MLSLPCTFFDSRILRAPASLCLAVERYLHDRQQTQVASAWRWRKKIWCLQGNHDNAGAWNQVELTIQRSSQLADHAAGHTSDDHAQDTSRSSPSLQHQQLQQESPARMQGPHQQQQSQEPQEQHNMVNNNLHHQQPVASPFAAVSYGQSAPPNGHLQGPNEQMQPPNGQLQASNGHQQTSDGHHRFLPGAGSQPVLLQTQPADQAQVQHSHLGQGQRPGPDLEQGLEPALAPGQGQGQVPAQRRRQTSEEEDGEKAAPGGLEKSAEEKLRGISRLEEDALEAKVAGPIGQSSSFTKTPSHIPKQPLLSAQHTSQCIHQAHTEMQHVMRVTMTA